MRMFEEFPSDDTLATYSHFGGGEERDAGLRRPTQESGHRDPVNVSAAPGRKRSVRFQYNGGKGVPLVDAAKPKRFVNFKTGSEIAQKSQTLQTY
jgi:hypothetical protein